MITNQPLILISIANGSFLCPACGETVYSTQHTCEEQTEENEDN